MKTKGEDEMNAEQLMGLGLKKETVEQVLELHKESLDGNYVTKSRFNEVNDEVKGLNEQLESQNSDDILAENESLKNELKQTKIDNVVNSAIEKSNAKNSSVVRSSLDLDGVELSEDGTIEGLEEKIVALKKSDGYLFNEETKKVMPSGVSPGQPKDREPDGKPNFENMSYTEFSEYFENQERGI